MKKITWDILWLFLSLSFWVNAWPQQLPSPNFYPPSDWSQNSPKTPSPPKISVSPTSVNFGNVGLGSTSEKTVTIWNKGKSDLVISLIDISDANASDFSQTNNCTTIPNGNSCTVTVAFTPTSIGKKTAIMSISSNDPKKPTVSVKLSEKAKSSACTYSISKSSQQFDASGGIGTINVTAASGCGWAAASKASWITITSGGSGSGNGTVNYSVAANTALAERTGTMATAGQTFTVTQSPCLAPGIPSDPSPPNGATGVSSSPTLGWAAASNTNSYDVSYGTSLNPPSVGNTTSTSYPVSGLTSNTTYAWQVVAKNNCDNSIPGPVWSFSTGSILTYVLSEYQQALMDSYGEPDYLTIAFNSNPQRREETWVYTDLQEMYLFWDGVSLGETSITVDPAAYRTPPYVDPSLFTKDTKLSDLVELLGSDYTAVDMTNYSWLIGDANFKIYNFSGMGLFVAFSDDLLVSVQTIDIPKNYQPPSFAAMSLSSGEQGSGPDAGTVLATPTLTGSHIYDLCCMAIVMYELAGVDFRGDPAYHDFLVCAPNDDSCHVKAAVQFLSIEANVLLQGATGIGITGQVVVPMNAAVVECVTSQQTSLLRSVTFQSARNLAAAAGDQYTYCPGTAQPCKDFDYGPWSDCGPDGTETRSYSWGQTPPGCKGKPPWPPVITRSCKGACTYSIPFTTAWADGGGGPGTIEVTTTILCTDFTAVSNVPWITMTSWSDSAKTKEHSRSLPPSVFNVSYTVAANTSGVNRIGTITVAGLTFTVTQIPCTYWISPPSAWYNYNAAVGSVQVTSTYGCPCNPVSNDPWITVWPYCEPATPKVEYLNYRTTISTVTYTVVPNFTGADRSGTITVVGLHFTVTQSGGIPCTDWDYGPWQPCQPDGTQYRSYSFGQTPPGCESKPPWPPVYTQSCTPPATCPTGYWLCDAGPPPYCIQNGRLCCAPKYDLDCPPGLPILCRDINSCYPSLDYVPSSSWCYTNYVICHGPP